MAESGGRGGNGGRIVHMAGGVTRLRFPVTDGKGCPVCGAIRGGGHGGCCPNMDKQYDEEGNQI